MRTPRKGPRGFTLLELMVVVGIVGLLASVAIPTFTRLTLRAKASERHEILVRIKKAVSDLVLQRGAIPGGTLTGDFQPPLPPGTTRRMPDWHVADWSEIFRTSEEIEGAVYYSYYFEATEGDPTDPSQPPTLTIVAVGDLDGDGVPSTKTLVFHRQNGVYQLFSEVPPEGSEDTLTF